MDGRVWVSDRYGVHKVGGLHHDFYVEPETGILREDTRHRKWRSSARERDAKRPKEVVPIEDGKEYRMIDGIWYLHEFVEVEVKRPVFLRGSFFRMDSEKQIISKSKRQLGKKQLKALGLRNGTNAVQLRSTSKASSNCSSWIAWPAAIMARLRSGSHNASIGAPVSDRLPDSRR